MPHDHSHHILHDPNHGLKKKSLLTGILANGALTIIELIIGLYTNSLALLSEALHDFTDTAALLLSYITHLQGKKKPSKKKSFGYQRATIMAAFVNGSILLILSLFLLYKSYLRLLNPEPVLSTWLIFTAIFGLFFNGMIVWKLGHHHEDLNLRSVWWHMMEDFLGWVVVLIGSILIYFTGWFIIDPILSIGISFYVMVGGYRMLNETIHVLLEGTPRGIDSDKVKTFICQQKNITGAHDLHIWSLGSDFPMLSCHIVANVKSLRASSKLVQDLKTKLKKEFNIRHATIECEADDCGKGC